MNLPYMSLLVVVLPAHEGHLGCFQSSSLVSQVSRECPQEDMPRFVSQKYLLVFQGAALMSFEDNIVCLVFRGWKGGD